VSTLESRLEAVARRARAAARAGAGDVDEERLAVAFCLLAEVYPNTPETRRVRSLLGEDVFSSMARAARDFVDERGLTL